MITPRKFRYDPEIDDVVEAAPVKITPQVAPAALGPTSARPRFTESAGVLPSQVAEARELVKKYGLVGCTVHDGGVVEFGCKGRTGRNGWNRMRAKTDFDGGFGDV